MLIKPDIEKEVKNAQAELDRAEKFKETLDKTITKYKKGDDSIMRYVLYFIFGSWAVIILFGIITLPFWLFISWLIK